MANHVGKEIKDFYCNGFFGRRYDLEGSIIEAQGRDWVLIRLTNGNTAHAEFISETDMEYYLKKWTEYDGRD